MRNFKAILSLACCSLGLLLIASVVRAVPMDPSGGQCSGLDPNSGLYSTCIQAHSARNRIAHLSSTRASANAVQQARNALNALLAQYASLGGGVVPGFEPACPCWNAAELASIDGNSPLGRAAPLQCVVNIYQATILESAYYPPPNYEQSQTFAQTRMDNKTCSFNSTDSAGVSLVNRFIENLTDAEVNACAAQVVARTVALGLICAGGD